MLQVSRLSARRGHPYARFRCTRRWTRNTLSGRRTLTGPPRRLTSACAMFHRSCGMVVLTLRLHRITRSGEARELAEMLQDRPESWVQNPWGYVDARGRAGLQALFTGAEPRVRGVQCHSRRHAERGFNGGVDPTLLPGSGDPASNRRDRAPGLQKRPSDFSDTILATPGATRPARARRGVREPDCSAHGRVLGAP